MPYQTEPGKHPECASPTRLLAGPQALTCSVAYMQVVANINQRYAEGDFAGAKKLTDRYSIALHRHAQEPAYVVGNSSRLITF